MSVSVRGAERREGCEGFTIIGFNGPKICQSRKPKSTHFLFKKYLTFKNGNFGEV